MINDAREAPLGVFDSGLGGLTVVPYGTKGAATVVKYALACSRHLVARDVKALVVACNTVSAVAPERLRVELDLPVLGVVEPGAHAAVAASTTGRIGVLATSGTIASGAYARAVAQVSTRAEVIGHAAPLLVPLAEEGWTAGDVPRLVARRYIEPLAQAGVDVVVLGCTHYPLLRDVIEDEVRTLIGPGVVVVDSARAVAASVAQFLSSRAMASRVPPSEPPVKVLVTDVPHTFQEVAARFLGHVVGEVEQIDL
jgi:glutamate racemase